MPILKYNFQQGTFPLHANQQRRQYAIMHLMLYGHRLPSFYQKNFNRLKMEKESSNVYWKMICDIYRHYDDKTLSWLDNYNETLCGYYQPSEYNGDRWLMFVRLYPIMVSLYGLDAVQNAIDRNIQKYPIPRLALEYTPLGHSMFDYRIVNIDKLGLDFNLVENFNRSSAEIQKKYIDYICKYIIKLSDNNRFAKENTVPHHNISRHDFWLAQLRLKNVPEMLNYFSNTIYNHYIFEWVLNSTEDPFELLIALSLTHTHYNTEYSFGYTRLTPDHLQKNSHKRCSDTPYYLMLEGLKPHDTYNTYIDRVVSKYYNSMNIDLFVSDTSNIYEKLNCAKIMLSNPYMQSIPTTEESLIL